MNRNNDIFLRVQKALNERFGFEQGEYVDLGLPSGTLWATCNLGANSPEESGLYFAWGETKGYSSQQLNTRRFEKLEYDTDNTCYDENGILTQEHDAASVILGENWHIPTKEDFEELTTLKSKWIDDYNGASGRLFTGYNGKTLFMVATGVIRNGSFDLCDESAYYWSSNAGEVQSDRAQYLWFSKHFLKIDKRGYRFVGCPIRPVC